MRLLVCNGPWRTRRRVNVDRPGRSVCDKKIGLIEKAGSHVVLAPDPEGALRGQEDTLIELARQDSHRVGRTLPSLFFFCEPGQATRTSVACSWFPWVSGAVCTRCLHALSAREVSPTLDGLGPGQPITMASPVLPTQCTSATLSLVTYVLISSFLSVALSQGCPELSR